MTPFLPTISVRMRPYGRSEVCFRTASHRDSMRRALLWRTVPWRRRWFPRIDCSRHGGARTLQELEVVAAAGLEHPRDTGYDDRLPAG
jgi:hypothetical protein